MAKLSVAILCIIVLGDLANAKPLARNTPAELARFLLSKTEWLSIATISTINNIKGYPFVNVKSTADGSSGTPYLFLTDLDVSVIDLHVDSRVSVLATFAGSECKKEDLDAQDPRCPRLILTGRFEKLSGDEEKFGRNALIKKHPIMQIWDHVHDFYIAKIVVENVLYLGGFGGADEIDVKDYFKADPNAVKHFL